MLSFPLSLPSLSFSQLFYSFCFLSFSFCFSCFSPIPFYLYLSFSPLFSSLTVFYFFLTLLHLIIIFSLLIPLSLFLYTSLCLSQFRFNYYRTCLMFLFPYQIINKRKPKSLDKMQPNKNKNYKLYFSG